MEVKSQEDLGKRRWDLGGASGGTQVSGVRRKREKSVSEAMAMAPYESFFKNASIWLSILVLFGLMLSGSIYSSLSIYQ